LQEKLQALKSTLSQIEKEYGKGAIIIDRSVPTHESLDDLIEALLIWHDAAIKIAQAPISSTLLDKTNPTNERAIKLREFGDDLTIDWVGRGEMGQYEWAFFVDEVSLAEEARQRMMEK
jgi:hypothetical protein